MYNHKYTISNDEICVCICNPKYIIWIYKPIYLSKYHPILYNYESYLII